MFFKKEKTKEAPAAPATKEEIQKEIRTFILTRTKMIKEADIQDGTKLFSSGLLDSLSFVQIVSFTERKFHVRLADANDVSYEALDTFGNIVDAVQKAVAHKNKPA